MNVRLNAPGGKLALLLGSAALAGCSMAPTYVRPDAPVSPSYPTGAAYADTADPATRGTDMGWRDFFRDPLLHDLIDMALANNRDVRVAALNVESARVQYRIQRSALLPEIAVVADGTAQHLPSDLAHNRRSYQVGAAAAAWELDLWGRIRSLSDQALESYLALDATRQAAQMSLVAEVANAYLTLRSDQQLLRLADETLASQNQSYALTQQLVDVGQLARLDLERAEVALRTAEADRAIYTRLAAQDRNALVLLLGAGLPADLAARLDTADSLPDDIMPADLPAGLPSDLLTRRPDIRAAEHMLRAANANIGAARAAFLPAISLTGTAGTASASLDDLFSSRSGAWSFIPRITLPIPIFGGSALRADLDRAEVQKRIEIATYEKAIQSAFRDVADGLAGRGTLDTQIRAQTQQVAASRNAYTLAQQRFAAGEDADLAQLDAQRTYYAAQQNLVRSRLARLGNLVNLYKALGGSWAEFAEPLDKPAS